MRTIEAITAGLFAALGFSTFMLLISDLPF